MLAFKVGTLIVQFIINYLNQTPQPIAVPHFIRSGTIQCMEYFIKKLWFEILVSIFVNIFFLFQY